MAVSDMDDKSGEAEQGRGIPLGDTDRRLQYERVLREALLVADDAAIIASERAALQGVVDRHRGQPLTLEPLTVDIVAALLSAAFRVRVEKSPMCIDMSRMIARSLWNDPVVRDRIDSLWSGLSEQGQ